MSKSRVESFKEYRKNMLGEEEVVEKTQIETSLKTTSSDASAALTPQEEVFLKKITNGKKFWTISFIIVEVLLISALVTFGLILFRS